MAINMFDYGCQSLEIGAALSPVRKLLETLFNLNVFSCSETKRRARQCNASRESQRGTRDSNTARRVGCAFPSAPFVPGICFLSYAKVERSKRFGFTCRNSVLLAQSQSRFRSRRAHGAGVKTPISCGLGTGEEEATEILDLP